MTFTCRVCGFETDSPVGIVSHSEVHKNWFRSLVGRDPEDYEEVVELWNRQPTVFSPFGEDQTTLVDYGGE
ncbi:hypothetical protein [Halovivax limisalsi]|uniref:hypothetical protein n=1 Tax=Halovivax limisalsi TaxID=1453760 RepID=UPI001FFDA339|nr:hypothetical protein [Halovivax limisalsi]